MITQQGYVDDLGHSVGIDLLPCEIALLDSALDAQAAAVTQPNAGTRMHRWLGDGILSKSLWQPTRESMARAWLVGFPITVVPLLPAQSIFACIAAFFVRGNLLLCIALQFLSTPLTAPVHLPVCYFVGEVVRGENPKQVWRRAKAEPRKILLSAHAVTSLYLGAAIIGLVGGVVGYAVIQGTWREGRIKPRGTRPPGGTAPPLKRGQDENARGGRGSHRRV